MAQVKNNSSINITRTQFSAGAPVDLGNKLFNGYVYALSLDVGFDGAPTTLVLNLALNKTLKQASDASTVEERRKRDIASLNQLNAARQTQTTPIGQISNKSEVYQGTSKTLSQLIDKDFNIEDQYIGPTTSYNVTIKNGEEGKTTYQLKNFRISSYSLSKRNNEKILTVTLKDNSFVLDKIYVGVLGIEVAIDTRSEIDAIVDKIILNCPPVNNSKPGPVTVKNFKQKLHFAEKTLANQLKNDKANTQIIFDEETGEARSNYIIIKSTDPLKQINNGYGAIILLGEEDFKDSICKASEIYYSFKSLIKAMKALGITILPANSSAAPGASARPDSLVDKSDGRIKRKYSGTLKNVLAQWCEEYSYSYVVDFSYESSSSINEVKIKGIDLADSLSKEEVLQTKLNLEDLEASQSSEFVIRSQDFDYDLSKKNLKLYSSLYFKDAKEQTIESEQSLGEKQFKNIKIFEIFPQLFSDGAGGNGYDFCGSRRTYGQVLVSAILGKYSPKMRDIYNYSIGAYQALGFLPIGGNSASSKLAYLDNDNLIAYEAVTRALELQSELIFDYNGNLLIDMNLGFYNESLATNVSAIESYIVEFIGKHYWTDVQNVSDGVAGNGDVLMQYSVGTVPPTEKVFANELYKLPVFRDARFLISSIASLFNGTESYFKAFSEFNMLVANTQDACAKAQASYVQYLQDLNRLKAVVFYTARTDAAYGIFQELIRGLEYLDYYISSSSPGASSSSNQLIRINLAEAYSPIFKELSPVTLGVLQAALPVDLTNLPLGNYSFGVLLGYKDIISSTISASNIEKVGQIFQFQFFPRAVFTNPIEYQNSIAETCEKLRDHLRVGAAASLNAGQKSCNKTIFYSVCVQPQEQSQTQDNNAAELKGLGPNPQKCQTLKITRNMPSEAFLQAHVNKTLQSSNGMLSLESPALSTINIQSTRHPNPSSWDYVKTRQEIEYITLPSQVNYTIMLKSKSSTQTFIPFRNFIAGGLEDKDDIGRILNNEGFSLELDVNNITPNVRELYADATTPSYASDQTVGLNTGDGTPVVMNFRGYSDETMPKYEFDTFQSYHNKLKKYYDYKSLSLLQPNVSYSADLFCSSITDNLKSALSVQNGLTKLNIALAENGLSIQCSFQSHPAKATNFQTLINKNRPNIKLVNTNFLS